MLTYIQPIKIQGVEYGSAIVRLTHIELTAAATSEVFTWDQLRAVFVAGGLVPANAEIIGARVIRSTDFAGGGAGVVTVSVGDASAPTELFNALDVFTGAKAAAPVSPVTLAAPAFEAAYVPQVTITSDVNVSTLTAGDCTLAILYRAYSTDAQV